MTESPKEPGFYWARVDGEEWEIVVLSEADWKGQQYAFSCGWEVPIPLETIHWGPMTKHPQDLKP